jgi:hypothetical protein
VGPKADMGVVEVRKPRSPAGNRTSSPSPVGISTELLLISTTTAKQQEVKRLRRTSNLRHQKGPNPSHLIGAIEPADPLRHRDVQSLDLATETGYPDVLFFVCGFPKFP